MNRRTLDCLTPTTLAAIVADLRYAPEPHRQHVHTDAMEALAALQANVGEAEASRMISDAIVAA